MLDRPTVIYRYDGSFEGLLCCVFESYERKGDSSRRPSARGRTDHAFFHQGN